MSLIKSQTLKAIKTYNLIENGDKIAVGVSGGKDSLLLLQTLYEINKYIIKNFTLIAITIDLNFDKDMDFSQVKRYCKEHNIPYFIKKTNIYNIVFENRQETNPCSLCSRMRAATLHDVAKEKGCNKIALGHHLDDVVETFIMNLFNEGRIGCFKPKTFLSRKEITSIRPFCFVKEESILKEIKKSELTVVKSPCPVDKKTNREKVKQLLLKEETLNKGLKDRIFHAIIKANLNGWGV